MDCLKQGIEVPLLLIFFALSLQGPIITNFVIYRTCSVILHYNESACAKLGFNSNDNATMELEKLVEPASNYLLMTVNLLTSVAPAIMCLFIGPWSDVLGRRTVMIASLIALLIENFLKIFISIFPVSPWLLLLQAIPNTLTGGLPTFIIVSLCFLTDITTPANRGMRMGMFEATLGIGMLLGQLSSSYVLKTLDYYGSFMICALLVLMALLYCIFFLKESVVHDENDCKKLFTCTHVKEMFITTFKQREGFNRFVLLATIAALAIYIFGDANGTAMNLLLRSKFGWTLKQFTMYSSMSSIVWIVGTFFGIFILHKLFGFSEIPLILLGLCCMSMSYVVVLLANDSWHIYTALGFRFFGGVISPMTRSFVSKIIPHDEIGKVFSLAVAMESFAAIGGSPVFALIYNDTINSFPAAFALLTLFCYVCDVFIFLIISLLTKRPNNVIYLRFDDHLN